MRKTGIVQVKDKIMGWTVKVLQSKHLYGKKHPRQETCQQTLFRTSPFNEVLIPLHQTSEDPGKMVKVCGIFIGAFELYRTAICCRLHFISFLTTKKGGDWIPSPLGCCRVHCV